MSLENKKLVIFDFDGVLADTEEFCFKIHKDFNGNLTWEKFQGFADGNFHEGMDKAVKEEAYIIPPDFYKLYEKNISVITIHDIIRDTIFQLKGKYILSIISSTSSSYISIFLKKEKVLDCFSDILGHDVHTSKIVKMNNLLEKYKINPKEAIFITDSLGDILEANECNINSIGVTWGIHERKTLERGNPIAIINDPRNLLETIQNVLK
jgi:phosphoglycolate phosphatase